MASPAHLPRRRYHVSQQPQMLLLTLTTIFELRPILNSSITLPLYDPRGIIFAILACNQRILAHLEVWLILQIDNITTSAWSYLASTQMETLLDDPDQPTDCHVFLLLSAMPDFQARHRLRLHHNNRDLSD